MDKRKSEEIRAMVRRKYGRIPLARKAGCGCSSPSCCGASGEASAKDISTALGYSEKDAASAPEGANLGLGCGNPQAIAALRPGQTVLDLGSGGGFDCFLVRRAVGEAGRVIGVDMTPEMIDASRINAGKAGYSNVEFRLGELENLPVADGIVDVVISNCVINLSPEKERVFAEAFRVLAPGGRLAVSDIVATAELPEEIRKDADLYAGCVAGASTIEALKSMIREAGFENIRIAPKEESRAFIREWVPGSGIQDYVVSAVIEAVKPGA